MENKLETVRLLSDSHQRAGVKEWGTMGSTDGEISVSMPESIKSEPDFSFFFSDQKHPSWAGCRLGSAENERELLDIKTELKSEPTIDEYVPSELAGWFMDSSDNHDVPKEESCAITINSSDVEKDAKARVNVLHENSLQEMQVAQCDTEVLILTEPNTSYQNGRVCHALSYKSVTKDAVGQADEAEAILARPDYLKSHLRIHTEESAHFSKRPTKQCPKRPSSSDKKNKTIGHRHKIYPCPTCGKVFNVKFNMEKHTILHTGLKAYVCHLCGKDFARPDYLKNHLMIHTDEGAPKRKRKSTKELPKNFACSHCEKTFVRARNLNEHICQHTQERPFPCHLCEQRFTRATNLRRHLDSHADRKPFLCMLCGHGFNHKDTLEKHQRIHTGEKPYTCSQCGKAFPYKYSLTCHMKTHVEGGHK